MLIGRRLVVPASTPCWTSPDWLDGQSVPWAETLVHLGSFWAWLSTEYFRYKSVDCGDLGTWYTSLFHHQWGQGNEAALGFSHEHSMKDYNELAFFIVHRIHPLMLPNTCPIGMFVECVIQYGVHTPYPMNTSRSKSKLK